MIFVQVCTPFVKLRDIIPAVRHRRNLLQTNQDLVATNEFLRQQVHAFGETARENIRLQDLLKFTKRHPLHSVGARVIGRDTSNWWKSIQIDRGTDDGVREDMPVVTADGLVGRTAEVTRSESRVLLLIDRNCKVSGLLQASREPGIVTGPDHFFSRRPQCQMTFVNRHVSVGEGELVISSGLGGVFPKGLVIGTVTHVELNPDTGMYLDVVIEPAVNFSKIEEVMVITQ